MAIVVPELFPIRVRAAAEAASSLRSFVTVGRGGDAPFWRPSAPEADPVHCTLVSNPLSADVHRPANLDSAWWARAAYTLGGQIAAIADAQIMAVLGGAAQVSSGGDGMTKDKALRAVESLSAAGAPSDGQRYALVGTKQWSQLSGISAFEPVDTSPYPGRLARIWLGVCWIHRDDLPVDPGGRRCFMWHRAAVAHARTISEPVVSVTDGEGLATFVASWGQGAAALEAGWSRTFSCYE